MTSVNIGPRSELMVTSFKHAWRVVIMNGVRKRMGMAVCVDALPRILGLLYWGERVDFFAVTIGKDTIVLWMVVSLSFRTLYNRDDHFFGVLIREKLIHHEGHIVLHSKLAKSFSLKFPCVFEFPLLVFGVSKTNWSY